MKTLVVGGGIGGLTAALCLAGSGHQVALFEQAAEFGEAGAGIQISPNASRVLHSLGLEPALQSVAFLPQGTQFRHWRSGNLITENLLGPAATVKFGAPYYHLHRGDLLRVLMAAASAHSGISLHKTAPVHSFEMDVENVSVTTGGVTHHGEVLIGADGIHSAIRTRLWGASAPQFTGNVAWRALVPADRLPADLIRPMATVWWGPGKHFVHYYVRGGQLVNCVCVVEQSGWEVESWTERGEIDELQSEFAGWHPDIAQLMGAAQQDSLYKWALFDRQPMPRWGKERATLLGDACHPTLPFMAQGAAMAIEDAAVLAGCLTHINSPVDALQRYEDLRRERCAGIQSGSRRNARVFHLSGIKAWARNRAASRAGKGAMERLYSYDALAVANSMAR